MWRVLVTMVPSSFRRSLTLEERVVLRVSRPVPFLALIGITGIVATESETPEIVLVESE